MWVNGVRFRWHAVHDCVFAAWMSKPAVSEPAGTTGRWWGSSALHARLFFALILCFMASVCDAGAYIHRMLALQRAGQLCGDCFTRSPW